MKILLTLPTPRYRRQNLLRDPRRDPRFRCVPGHVDFQPRAHSQPAARQHEPVQKRTRLVAIRGAVLFRPKRRAFHRRVVVPDRDDGVTHKSVPTGTCVRGGKGREEVAW